MSEDPRLNLLDSAGGRRLLFTALYLSEGAPIGYVWWALPTMLRSASVPLDRITLLTASLTLVWALKFLWAPLVDTVRSPRWGIRQWIVLTQVCMGLALVPLLVTPLEGRLALMTAVLFVHALFASTQDASVDALCIATTTGGERGGINGWMQVGMLLGRALFGGVALYAERWIGHRGILLCLVFTVWSSTLLVLFFTREPTAAAPEQPAAPQPRGVFFDHLKRACRSPGAWLAIGFALTGGAAFEAAGAVAGPMLVDLGIAEQRVGVFFALPVVIGTGLGALTGGMLSDRLGHTRAVACFTLAIAIDVAALAGVHMRIQTIGVGAVVALLVVLYLLYGAFAASSYAMFMDLTDPRLGATQFSALMGATNLCEVWSTFAVGRLIVASGYGSALLTFSILSLASMLFLARLRIPRPESLTSQPA